MTNPYPDVVPREVRAYDRDSIDAEVRRRVGAVEAALTAHCKERGHKYAQGHFDGRYVNVTIRAQHRFSKLTNKLYISFSGIYRRLDAKNFPEPKDGFDIAKIGDLIIHRATEDLERERAQTKRIERDKQTRAFYVKLERLFAETDVNVRESDPEHVLVELCVTEVEAHRLRKALKEIYR